MGRGRTRDPAMGAMGGDQCAWRLRNVGPIAEAGVNVVMATSPCARNRDSIPRADGLPGSSGTGQHPCREIAIPIQSRPWFAAAAAGGGRCVAFWRRRIAVAALTAWECCNSS